MATPRKRTSNSNTRNLTRTAQKVGGKKYGWIIVVVVILIAMLWNFFADGETYPQSTPNETTTTQTVEPSGEPTSIETPVETVIPEPSVQGTEANEPPASNEVDAAVVKATLDSLNVAPKLDVKYDRKTFGTPWKDVDKNGCDTRNDILIRDFDEGSIVFIDGGDCKVESGTLQDPYTGMQIDFVQGHGSLVDIEHVVALGEAAKSGALELSAEQRVEFANDPSHLIAVDAPANRQKGDKDASEWLVPDNESFQCEYVEIQVNVKAKYGLSVSNEEKAAMLNVIDNKC